MIFLILLQLFLLLLTSAEDHFQFGDTAAFDKAKCPELRTQLDKCRQSFEQFISTATVSTLNPLDVPDECKRPWGYIIQACDWQITDFPSNLPKPTGRPRPSTTVTVTVQPSEMAMEKRDTGCPSGYHWRTDDFERYYYYFCCPDDANELRLPKLFSGRPVCCNKGDKQCVGKPVSMPDTCMIGHEVTDWAGIKGCRGLKKVKRNGDVDAPSGGDRPSHGDRPHGFPPGFPIDAPFPFPTEWSQGWPGPTWFPSGPTTLDTKTSGARSTSASTSVSKSGTTTLTQTVTPPVARAETTQPANVWPSGLADPEEVRFPGVTFQWPGGVCKFCEDLKQDKVGQGRGLPYGVYEEPASKECSTSTATCTSTAPCTSKTTEHPNWPWRPTAA